MKLICYFFILATLAGACINKKPRFQLMDFSQTGIDFENTITEYDSLHVMNFEYIYNGAGVGVADLNNDDLQDLIFTGNQVPTKVYLNQGDFTFRDISSRFEDLNNGQWVSGVSVVDINSDGWLDLYFTCTAHPEAEMRKNRFYINQGTQSDGQLLFKDMAKEYQLDDDSYGVHSAFFDYDLDGDLDLYLLNNYVNERLSAGYREKIIDGSALSNDDLYVNNGDGTFSDVTIEAGILFEGFGLGLALGDVNKDGYIDLYISNDYVSNDVLYINQGNGTFKNEIRKYLSYQTKSSMGNDMADINNDGNPDILTLDMMPESYAKKKQTINGFSYIYYIYDDKYDYEHQYLRNMLHLHNGFINGEMIPYSEVGQIMGVYQTEWSWSPLFADFDNDGDKDLFVTNGFPKDLTDKDWTKYKADVYGFVADEKHVMDRAPAVKAVNYAFENDGNNKFVNVTDRWFNTLQSYSYGAAFVDLDNDGDLDYVVNNTDDEAFIFKNNTRETSGKASNYVKVKLKGNQENRLAFGAKIEIWAEGEYQFQEYFLSRGYISSVDPVVHFGLGTAQQIDSIVVSWPGGKEITKINSVEANQLLEIAQENAIKISAMPSTAAIDLMFTPSDSMIDYTHQQEDFIDFFFQQNILPHKFSQIGPRTTKGDLNGDGAEDIIIGASNALPTTVLLNSNGSFNKTNITGLTESRPFSEADLAILDVDNDGDNDVVAIAGGYENKDEGEYKHYLYRNNQNVFERSELPIEAFSASVVRACDYDQDGDMDLFIGARIKKDMYPFAADSWILLNDKGNFTKEAAMNFNLGMVTDAVWSDYNGDGWKDLIIAREWNSIAIIENINGERLSSKQLPEIESRHGHWYSIAASDFDNDGDQDYILGNLGNNHRFHVSDSYPMRIHAVDVDMNGTLDPITTAYWKNEEGVMTEYPINYLDEMVAQISVITKKYSDYNSFSYASIHDILDQSVIDREVYPFKINTTSSSILWNEGDKFRWEELPEMVQYSPVKKMIITDLNGDSLPDAILGGNDYTFDVSTGYYDANKGLILISADGKALSKLLTPAESGLLLQGMVESMLLFDGDNPTLMVGYNRESIKTYSLKN